MYIWRCTGLHDGKLAGTSSGYLALLVLPLMTYAGTVQDDWYRRAQLAVEKGDDELAKEALKRRKSNQENADVMKAQLDQQRKAVDQLISNTKWVPLSVPDTIVA